MSTWYPLLIIKGGLIWAVLWPPHLRPRVKAGVTYFHDSSLLKGMPKMYSPSLSIVKSPCERNNLQLNVKQNTNQQNQEHMARDIE